LFLQIGRKVGFLLAAGAIKRRVCKSGPGYGCFLRIRRSRLKSPPPPTAR
jgi:hypothetical protein